MKRTYRTQSISFSGREELLEAVKALAQKDDRSVSKFICKVLQMYVDRQSPFNSGDFDASPMPADHLLAQQLVAAVKKHSRQSKLQPKKAQGGAAGR